MADVKISASDREPPPGSPQAHMPSVSGVYLGRYGRDRCCEQPNDTAGINAANQPAASQPNEQHATLPVEKVTV